MKNINNFLQLCDVFGQPIQFSLNRKYLQKSCFGGVMTFLLISIFVGIAFSGFQDLINRQNLLSYMQEIYGSIPPSIDFSSRKISLAVSFNNYTLNDPRYFKLELIQGYEIRDSTGTKEYTFINQDISPCIASNFPDDITASLLKISSNISTLLCPPADFTVNVAGAYSSTFFSYYWIKLSKCQNTTNVTCFSDDIIQNMFQQIGRVYLNVYFTNNIIAANNYQNPVSSFLDDRIYVLVDLNAYKEDNFYFTQNKIFTDSSLLYTNYQEDLETYTYENIYDETILSLDTSNSSDITYAGMFFRSNILGKSFMRTFDKIGKFIGYIGGFWSMLYLFFSVVGKSYNSYKLLLKMTNSLYNFSTEKKVQPKIGKKIQGLHQVKFIGGKKDGLQKEEQYKEVDQKIETVLNTKNKIKLPTNFKSYLVEKITSFFGIYKCFSENPFFDRFILQKNALLAVQKDTDIIQLLTKIKEIDKFKRILLSHSQQKLFDYFPKETINKHGRERATMSRSSMTFFAKTFKVFSNSLSKRKSSFNPNLIESMNNNLDIYEAFKLVWREEHENHEGKKSLLNQKILECFDPKLIDLFKEKYNFEMERNESKFTNTKNMQKLF